METSSERYTKFEDLADGTEDIKDSTRCLFSDDWSENFQAVTKLRAFIKYHWDEFKYYWIYLKPRIFQLCSSLRSTLAKNTLMFMSELLDQYREGLQTNDILILLFSRSSIEKSFLKSETIIGIENACRNYPSSSNCIAILTNSFSKSVGIAKLSFKYLDSMISKLKIEEKFEILLKLSEGKRQEHIVIAKKILLELELAWDDYQSNLLHLSSRLLAWIHELKAPKNQEKLSIKEVIKSKKENICKDMNSKNASIIS